jgi:hypothetical protein
MYSLIVSGLRTPKGYGRRKVGMKEEKSVYTAYCTKLWRLQDKMKITNARNVFPDHCFYIPQRIIGEYS